MFAHRCSQPYCSQKLKCGNSSSFHGQVNALTKCSLATQGDTTQSQQGVSFWHTRDRTDDPWAQDTERNKPAARGQTLDESTHIGSLEQ